MQITSSAFQPGAPIPRRHTCEGEDVSPPLAWREAPAGTRSFALIMDDPDAPVGTFTHWILWDIPGEASSLEEGMAKAAEVGSIKQGRNDFRSIGYGGPCPPRGHGPHRYFFKLYALDVPTLGLAGGSSRGRLETAMRGHILAEAQVMGTYERR